MRSYAVAFVKTLGGVLDRDKLNTRVPLGCIPQAGRAAGRFGFPASPANAPERADALPPEGGPLRAWPLNARRLAVLCLTLLLTHLFLPVAQAQNAAGYALSFDGTNDFARASGIPLGDGSFTVEAWFNNGTPIGTNVLQALVAKTTNSPPVLEDGGWALRSSSGVQFQ